MSNDIDKVRGDHCSLCLGLGREIGTQFGVEHVLRVHRSTEHGEIGFNMLRRKRADIAIILATC